MYIYFFLFLLHFTFFTVTCDEFNASLQNKILLTLNLGLVVHVWNKENMICK